MEKKEIREYLASLGSVSQDFQEKGAKPASQDSQVHVEIKVRRVKLVCPACQDMKDLRENKDSSALQVSQVYQVRRVSLGLRGLPEKLVVTAGLVKVACRDLLVLLERRESLE